MRHGPSPGERVRGEAEYAEHVPRGIREPLADRDERAGAGQYCGRCGAQQGEGRVPLPPRIAWDIAWVGYPAQKSAQVVATSHGPLTVYVAHLGSIRLMPRGGFRTASRNIGVQTLGKAVAADPSKQVVLLGDLNGTTGNRALAGLTSQLRSAQEAAGSGFGFTWPAAFPAVRVDQILVRGVEPDRSWVLPADGSDHLPVEARIGW